MLELCEVVDMTTAWWMLRHAEAVHPAVVGAAVRVCEPQRYALGACLSGGYRTEGVSVPKIQDGKLGFADARYVF